MKPITITLNQIKAHGPCEGGWETILTATHLHGGDYDKPFPLSAALDTNGLYDTLWALRCLPEHDRSWRKYAVWCARQVQHLMTDQRSTDALDVADRHAEGLATDEELDAARGAAQAAAWAASWPTAARGAAQAAAWAASWPTAAWAAAQAAALDAARAEARAAAWGAKLRQVLDAEEVDQC